MSTSYLYRHVHSREASPLYFEDSDPVYSPRPLVRYNTKRQHADVYSGTDDDGYDDYPRGATPKEQALTTTTTSRALTVRRPSQLERFNVFNHRDDDDDDHHHHHHHGSKHVKKYYVSDPHSRSRSKSRSRLPTPDSDSDSDRKDREFRLKIKASLGRPRRPSHSHPHSERHHNHVVEVPMPMAEWSGDMFRSRRKSTEKWERDEYVDVFESETDRERDVEVVRYRKVKRTRTRSRTDEWRPLSGFRRG